VRGLARPMGLRPDQTRSYSTPGQKQNGPKHREWRKNSEVRIWLIRPPFGRGDLNQSVLSSQFSTHRG